MKPPYGERWLVLLMGLTTLWLWATKLIGPAIRGPLVDYGKHYQSAYLMIADMKLIGVIEYYYYPTFLGLLHQPLYWFREPESAVAWSIGNAVLLLAGCLILADHLRLARFQPSGNSGLDRARGFLRRHALLVVLLAVGAFEPIQRVMRSGNVDPLNFLLASLLLALFARGHDTRAGIVAGLFCLVKIVPVLLVPVLVVLKKWRLLAMMASVLVAYVAWLLVTGWWREDAFLFREVLPGVPWLWQGISLSVHRLLATAFNPAVLESPLPYARFILAINMVTGFAYCAFLLLAGRRGIPHPDLLLAAGLVVILFFSPLLETIHFSWIFPAFAIQAAAWVEGRIGHAPFCAVVIGWMGLTAADTLSTLLTLRSQTVENWMIQTALYMVVVGLSFWVALRATPRGGDQAQGPDA